MKVRANLDFSCKNERHEHGDAMDGVAVEMKGQLRRGRKEKYLSRINFFWFKYFLSLLRIIKRRGLKRNDGKE